MASVRLLLFLAVLSHHCHGAERLVVVNGPQGPLGGREDGRHSYFKAVPFARAPVGDLRWRQPEPPANWVQLRDASELPPLCLQLEGMSHSSKRLVGSEDCLYLNIWTPVTNFPTTQRLPVMVFIHGGSYLRGGTAQTVFNRPGYIYDGAKLAQRENRVVVTIQYRLGALGFSLHPGMVNEAGGGALGNFAMHDQLAALRWVKNHIASFGGDNSQILLFGESAGAHSVYSLLASPLSSGLFQAAVLQSSPHPFVDSLATAYAKGLELAKRHRCDKPSAAQAMKCLRGVPAEEITLEALADEVLSGFIRAPYVPVVDGTYLTDSPAALVARGQFQQVPLLVGSNAEELPAMLYRVEDAQASVEQFLQERIWPAWQERVRARYALATYGSYADVKAALVSDVAFTCPALNLLSGAFSHQSVKMYRYVFRRSLPGPISGLFGAFHALEVMFLFGNLEETLHANAASADHTMSGHLQDIWANFGSRAGRKQLPPALEWNPEQPTHLNLEVPLTYGRNYRQEECELLNEALIDQLSPRPR